MGRNIDVAVTFLEKSIELAEKEQNPEYYMDFVKLHKLMFLAQIYSIARYNICMFYENITVEKDGPYIEGIGVIPGTYGFEKITNDDNKNRSELNKNLLSPLREKVIYEILYWAGKYNTSYIVDLTKYIINEIKSKDENYIFNEEKLSFILEKNDLYEMGLKFIQIFNIDAAIKKKIK